MSCARSRSRSGFGADERRQLADELRVLPAGEIGVDPRLERRKPLLLELAARLGRERLVREIGERLSTPERERLAEACAPRSSGARRRARARPRSTSAPEALEVDLLG